MKNHNAQKVVKYVTLFLSSLFVGIVLLERFPGVLTATSEPYEYLMFNLFKISLLDDITHFLSGVLGFIALYKGYRFSVYYLMLVGGYYVLDATFYIVNGFATGQSIVDNLSLNLPHIGISALIIFALYKSLKRVELQ